MGLRRTFETSHTAVEERLLRRALPRDGCVLEAGCGRRTRLASHRDRIARLIGLDLDRQAGNENDALDEFVQSDLCERLPFDDAVFDVVYTNFVVEHLDRPAAAFAEWRRILRGGGALILLTSNLANPLLLATRLVPRRGRTVLKRAGAGVAEHDVLPVHYRANTPWRLAALLRGAGFALVEVSYVATLHRYAECQPVLAAALRWGERCLPPPLRSTIVGLYRAV